MHRCNRYILALMSPDPSLGRIVSVEKVKVENVFY